MFSQGQKLKEASIFVQLEELLTSDSCSKIIIELIKYILYQKQQIPFSCDVLVQQQSRTKPTDRNFSSTKTLLNTLDNIADQLKAQLHLGGCDVREVVIIIGATTITPKFCVRLELPIEILSSKKHLEYQHSYRKPLLHLMRSLVGCPEFQEAMSSPVSITNTFLLVHKRDANPISDFFLPKPQYNPLVSTATCISIKLTHNKNHLSGCTCLSIVKVYNDNQQDNADSDLDEKSDLINVGGQGGSPYIWYQSKEIVKGFKYFR